MANNWFQFREFLIRQDRCAMKVGTDGVILGAWADPGSGNLALDIGTGTGLLALMLAQRSPGLSIEAIEIDGDAAAQATENVAESRFAGRIRIHHTGFAEYLQQEHRFDLIITNPPYFPEKVLSPDPQRVIARHSGSLGPDLLFGGSAGLLTDRGSLALIIPAGNENAMLAVARNSGLYPNRRMTVLPNPGKPAGRVCLQFGKTEGLYENRELIIETDGRMCYSPEFLALTAAFYPPREGRAAR